MKNLKNLVVALCLSAGLIQMPAANAQIEAAAAPLIQMGLQLASQLVPMMIPVVVGGTVMGVRAGMMLPSYVKERMPRPHFRSKKRKVADTSAIDPNAATAENYDASENVSGSVIDENKFQEEAAQAPVKSESNASRTNKAETEQSQEAQSGPTAASQESSEAKQSAPAKPRRAAKDASEWYMDEE